MSDTQIVNFWPTREDVTFYQEHGWFITPKIIPDQVLDAALHGLERHWAGERDWVLPISTGYADWKPGNQAATRNNEYLSLQNKDIRALALHPNIGRIAAELAGTSTVRLFDDQMIYKTPGQRCSAVGWHVDKDYWATCSSDSMLTAWIPLDDCPEELGPLVIVDKSHRWSRKLDRRQLSFHQQDMSLANLSWQQLGVAPNIVAMALKRGQVSFHHCLCLHGSFPNTGDRPRIALAVHLQDASNRYRVSKHADGRTVQLFNDLICTRTPLGYPDYSDDAAFPLLYSESPCR